MLARSIGVNIKRHRGIPPTTHMEIEKTVKLASNRLHWSSLHLLHDHLVTGNSGSDDGYNLEVGIAVDNWYDSPETKELKLTYPIQGGCGYGSRILANSETGYWHIATCGGHWLEYTQEGWACDTHESSTSWGDHGRTNAARLTDRIKSIDHRLRISKKAMAKAVALDKKEKRQREWEFFKGSYRGTRLYQAARKAGFGDMIPQ